MAGAPLPDGCWLDGCALCCAEVGGESGGGEAFGVVGPDELGQEPVVAPGPFVGGVGVADDGGHSVAGVEVGVECACACGLAEGACADGDASPGGGDGSADAVGEVGEFFEGVVGGGVSFDPCGVPVEPAGAFDGGAAGAGEPSLFGDEPAPVGEGAVSFVGEVEQ